MSCCCIDWNRFAEKQTDEGRWKSFEDLCWYLFWYEYLAGNTSHTVFPLYRRNHPILETEPEVSERLGKKVGFQVKYYHDAESTVRAFSETAKALMSDDFKDDLDTVFFYSYRELNSDKLKEIIETLGKRNISVEFIYGTNLDNLILSAPGFIREYYFGEEQLYPDLFRKHIEKVRCGLSGSDDYSNNVITKTGKLLSLFTSSARGVKLLNDSKFDTADLLAYRLLGTEYHKFKGLMLRVRNVLLSLPDVKAENIAAYEEWYPAVLEKVKDEIRAFHVKFSEDNEKLEADEKLQGRYQNCLYNIEEAIKRLKPDNLVRNSLEKKVMVIHGNGGDGKTHVFLNEAESLIKEGRPCLFVCGGDLSDTHLSSNYSLLSRLTLNLDVSQSEFLEMLEHYGETGNTDVVIFIDAINECSNAQEAKRWLSVLFSDICKSKRLKVAVSLRREYLKHYLPAGFDSYGFCADMDSDELRFGSREIRSLLQLYGVPLSSGLLQSSMFNNPLYLKQLCRLYASGEFVGDQELFDAVVFKAYERTLPALRKSLDNSGMADINWVELFVDDFCDYEITYGRSVLSKSEVKSLPFWDDRKLACPTFVEKLKETGILKSSGNGISFLFEMMNDYFLAVRLVETRSREEIREFVSSYVLPTGESSTAFNNVDLFSRIASQYAGKYNEECSDLLLGRTDAEVFIREYIRSFSRRPEVEMTADEFIDMAGEFGLDLRMEIWACFVLKATDASSPFNSERLFDYLIKLPMAERDSIWTVCINRYGDSPDISSYIRLLLEENDSVVFADSDSRWCILLLLTWFLSSTDRKLRYKASKRMVCFLQTEPLLCEKLLRKFENVDDYFILERLYEIAFGVVTRSRSMDEKTFSSLVEYVYESVFVSPKVQPDAVIIDSAYLIIRYYLYRYPQSLLNGKLATIESPFRPEPLPEVLKRYRLKKKDCGANLIIRDMDYKTDCGGNFWSENVIQLLHDSPDIERRLHDYALNLIFDVYGYTDSLFDSHDMKLHQKNEGKFITDKMTIGEKYQRIALNNVIARAYGILKFNPYCDWLKDLSTAFRFRLFDPTVNLSLSGTSDAGWDVNDFQIKLNDRIYHSLTELRFDDTDANLSWFRKDFLKSSTKYMDKAGNQWISLILESNIAFHDEDNEYIGLWNPVFWGKMTGAFLSDDALEILEKHKREYSEFDIYGCNYSVADAPSFMYAREFPWHKEMFAYFDDANKKLSIYRPDGTYVAPLEDSFISVFSAYEEAHVLSPDGNYPMFYTPCVELVETCNLSQGDASDYEWFRGNELVGIYNRVVEGNDCFFIRKDVLDSFLEETGRTLVWLVSFNSSVKGDSQSFSGYVKYKKDGFDCYVF